MLYQNQDDYLFDSTKFHNAFNFAPTGYKEGIRVSAAAYQTKSGSGIVSA